MTENSISRWNAIPLSRTDEPSPSLKHPRPGEEEEDDGVSIVSRTPSPPPMDVDADVYKYDEYLRSAPSEVITVETRIKSSNKGFAMLAKLGWSEGQPLGISGDGRVDPIPFQIKRDLTGLGKTNQDVRMIETTVSQRRGLDSERQQKETEDQRRAREELVARKSALEDEISTTLKAFYCTLCDKQFKTVAQYDEHTNSYAHHHKARFRDMQANVRLKPKEEVDKRKEKERKREEKELRKIAAANGIKMPKPVGATPLIPADTTSPASNTMDVDSLPAAPKRGGWSTVSGSTGQTPRATSGWASVGPGSAPPPPPPHESSTSSNGSPGTHIPPSKPSSAPAFRTAGWTSLDTGSSQTAPPIPATSDLPPPAAPPSVPPSRGGWSSVTSNSASSGSSGWSRATKQVIPPSSHPLLPTAPPPAPSRGGWSSVAPNGGSSGSWSNATAQSSSVLAAPPPPSNQPPSIPGPVQPIRSGWQQFQKSGPKRR